MKLKHLLLLILVMFIWGVNFSAIKLGINGLDPFLVAAARFFFATFPIIFFVPKPNVPFKYLALYGLTFGTGVWGMAYCAIALGLSSGMASVLLKLDVITSVLFGVIFFKEVLSRKLTIGIVVALVGLLVSIVYTNGNITLAGVGFILIASICWPLAGLIIKKSGTDKPFAFNIWGMLIAPIPLILLSLSFNGFSGISDSLTHWSAATWFAVLFQAYPTTVFGYWVWNNMLLRYPMTMLAPFPLLTGIFALLSGYLFYAETLSPMQFLSCFMFLVGIAIVVLPKEWLNKARRKKPSSAAMVNSAPN